MTVERNEVEFGWYIPTYGDGNHVGVRPERETDLSYIIQLAQHAEKAGFTFALIPTGGTCLDAWVVGSAIISSTTTFRPLIAMRPGLVSPVLAARMAASFDYLSQGRLLINVVTGSSAKDLRMMGDPLADSHDERYERTREFLQIVKGLWANSSVNNENDFFAVNEPYQDIEPLQFTGNHYNLEAVASYPATQQRPHPPLYFGGSSASGKRVAAELADVYLMWAEPLNWIQEQIGEMEALRNEQQEATGIRRPLKYGLRVQILVRQTEEEAWRDAWEIISKVNNVAIEQAEERFTKSDAVNQIRQNKLRTYSKENQYLLGPNLWSGLSTVRSGGSLMLVGTPDQVSDRIIEYIRIGVSSFILSGFPHLEEADIAGELLLPLIKEKLKQEQYTTL
ncbi:LLM class flavin-dependent oxidoreductase [Cohnella abietis]|uniref:Alkanesulfonate monooxygenase n=1 Tax=Cohnella abietis TaxID=2507935 RepID=A0A3T1DBP4_9BACL|nr:LLM class flavin-dependent oxidoreductase [Cohnella abietis]BBI35517.1 alkanesulfonate monooxygenase [Cohnella abietis]